MYADDPLFEQAEFERGRLGDEAFFAALNEGRGSDGGGWGDLEASWDATSYAEGVAHCTTATGPCRRSYTSPVVASRSTMVGPGSGTPFQDASGGWSLAFQAWESPYVGYDDFGLGKRSLRILPITFPSSLPKVG